MPSARRPAPARGRATRGPLPAGVYWRRRVFVLGVAFALVFVIARWLGGGSDASSDAPAAEQAGARVEATQTVTAGKPTATATGTTSGEPAGTAATAPTTPTLAAPEGPCDPADVVVTPSVAEPAEAGGDVTLHLSLQTSESEACTWTVSRSTVTVKIADGADQVWSSQQCPKVVPTESVVVRRAVATVVELTWNGRESAARCAPRTEWVWFGDYTIAAAALGGEPVSTEFTLVKPTARKAATTGATTKPTAKSTAKSTTKSTAKASTKSTAKSTAKATPTD